MLKRKLEEIVSSMDDNFRDLSGDEVFTDDEVREEAVAREHLQWVIDHWDEVFQPYNTTDALEVRMVIKSLIREAREHHGDFDFQGDVDEEDVAIEALIHPETLEILVRPRGDA